MATNVKSRPTFSASEERRIKAVFAADPKRRIQGFSNFVDLEHYLRSRAADPAAFKKTVMRQVMAFEQK